MSKDDEDRTELGLILIIKTDGEGLSTDCCCSAELSSQVQWVLLSMYVVPWCVYVCYGVSQSSPCTSGGAELSCGAVELLRGGELHSCMRNPQELSPLVTEQNITFQRALICIHKDFRNLPQIGLTL